MITPMTAAIVGLALNEAAYMAEIIRGGLLSVDRGQAETAQAFGMTKGRALWRIIIPQAMRSIVPPTGNQLISMIKATSLVSVIAMADLLYSVQSIYNRTFEIIPMLLVAVLWYLLITSVLNIGQSYIEAYYGRSDRRNGAAAASRPPAHCRRQAIDRHRQIAKPLVQATQRPQVLRPARSAEGHRPRRHAGRGRRHPRPVRLRANRPSCAVSTTSKPSRRALSRWMASRSVTGCKNDRLEKLSLNGIARQRRKIGMVFQQFNLYPHMTVLQNIIEAPVGVHR